MFRFEKTRNNVLEVIADYGKGFCIFVKMIEEYGVKDTTVNLCPMHG
jgi:hypothetical protein